jgi:transposase InsO family protein
LSTSWTLRRCPSNILDREFTAPTPNSKWVSDTTFIYTKQGWLYLATIIDLYSRKVVGWSMGSANDTALVSEALQMAIKNKPKQQKVLLHSDQESTYIKNLCSREWSFLV